MSRATGSVDDWIVLETVIVSGYTIGAAGLLLSDLLTGPVRLLLVVPLVAFLPGYATLSALVPGAEGFDGATLTTERLRLPGLAWFERCSLSVAASIGMLPIIAIILTEFGIRLTAESVALALVCVIVAGVVVGLIRRLRMPPEARYEPPIDRWRAEILAATDESRNGLDTALTVALVLVIAFSMAGVAYGFAAPQRGESFTEAGLLTQQNDTLIAGNYTTTVTRGEPIPVTLSIENHEGRQVEYTVVTVVERVRTTRPNSTDSFAVLERRELRRTNVSVADGSVRNTALNLSPQMLGDRLRLSFLVYAGDAPATPTIGQADAHLYLWIRVQQPSRVPARSANPTGSDGVAQSAVAGAEG